MNEQARTCTNNGFKLDKCRFKKAIGRNWFTDRVVDEWNRLSSQIVRSNTIENFKFRYIYG